MQKAYLLYSEEDAVKNHLFIDQLQREGRTYDVDLQLIIDSPSLRANDYVDGLFFWNRTRHTSLSRQLEGYIRVINRSTVNEIANDKRKALQFTTLLGIPTVPEIPFERLSETDFPVVVKSIDGHGGLDVQKCHTLEEVQRYLKKVPMSLIEPYIETNATDVRVWMIGDEIIGAVKRIGAAHDFRSNYTLGGSIEKFSLTAQQVAMLKKIQRALKSDYIGIDFLHINDEDLLFNEMEDPVGARSFYDLYDATLPQQLWQHIMKSV